MEIEYALTEKDVLALAQYRLQFMPTLRRRLWKRRWALAIGFTLVALGTWPLTPDFILPSAFLALAVISFLLYPTYNDWRLRRRVSEMYRGERIRATLGARTLRATSEGLEEESHLGETKIKWSAIDEIDVTPQRIFISVAQVPSIVISRGQVSAGDLEEFVQTCRNHLESVAVRHTGE
jgi:hypothetical protein